MPGNTEGVTRRRVLKKTAIGGVSLTGVTGLASAKQKKSNVSKREARKIAKKAVGHIGTRTEFDTWREQGVKSPELFYAKVSNDSNIVYTPRAWVFPIENHGDDVGYIAIDAKQIDSPVLAYGKSEAPQRNVDDAMQVAKANGSSIHKRFLYHGGSRFGIETSDRNLVDLRNKSVTTLNPVQDQQSLLPSRGSEPQTFSKDEGDAPDWSGGTDGEVYGVPNWTSTDPGGASSTSYGTGQDSWDDWDGCTPIAASMAIGYHEGLIESDANEREALIDRLHVDLNTDDGGSTNFDKIPAGIETYEEGSNSYSAANEYIRLRNDTEQAVDNNNPPILSMWNGPYTKNKSLLDGHSITVVGYRTESCGWVCTDFYYKVHNGYGSSPDRILHGNWNGALVTKVWT